MTVYYVFSHHMAACDGRYECTDTLISTILSPVYTCRYIITISIGNINPDRM